MAGEDGQRYDRPELLPHLTNAADQEEIERREKMRLEIEREDRRFLKRMLSSTAGRRFVWGILQASGAFEERYGFGPTGAPHSEATWAYRGQKDLGLRLYHSWSILDREGILALLDEFHPLFPKPRGK